MSLTLLGGVVFELLEYISQTQLDLPVYGPTDDTIEDLFFTLFGATAIASLSALIYQKELSSQEN